MPITLKKTTDAANVTAWQQTDYDANMTAIENAVNVLDSGAVIGRGTLANNTDLNTVKTNGVYLLSSGNTYTNMPAGATSGILIVVAPLFKFAPAAQVAVQWFVSWSASYERYATSMQWSNWR